LSNLSRALVQSQGPLAISMGRDRLVDNGFTCFCIGALSYQQKVVGQEEGHLKGMRQKEGAAEGHEAGRGGT